MAYDAPEAATDDLLGKAQQAAPDLPAADGINAPPALDQVESGSTPDTGGGTSTASLDEPSEAQLDGPKLTGEEGTGLTGGPIGN